MRTIYRFSVSSTVGQSVIRHYMKQEQELACRLLILATVFAVNRMSAQRVHHDLKESLFLENVSIRL